MDFQLTEEQSELQLRVRKLVQEKIAPMANEIEERGDYPFDMLALLAENGLLKLLVPEEYGGQYPQILALPICLAREELARGCTVTADAFVMQGLGSYPIVGYGNHEQKSRYLPPIANGEEIAALGLTEPDSGSDVAGAKTTAVLEGDFYLLNGKKRFISNAPHAHTYVTFAKTDPEAGHRGLSAFILEKETPGFEFGERLELMSPHAIGELVYENCRIPRQNLLGEEGEGFKISMYNLNIYRTTVGAQGVGIAQAAFDAAFSYAQERVSFGKSIINHQSIGNMLADMSTQIKAARLLVHHAAWLKDSGVERVAKDASMAKLYGTEMAKRVVDMALQIHGGNGLVRGSVTERLYRAVRALTIYEGSSEIQRIVINNEIQREA